MLPDLLVPAMTVAMLGAIESLLSATVADRMMGTRHNPNVELIAQGVANFFSPLVGGLPATGAIARTATNIRSGAKTPVAGMIHAITLLLILLFAAPLAAQVPLAVLAGLLFIVAYNMGEWHEIPSLLKMTKADIVGVARHVCADGRGRSDGGGRSGDGAGGAAVHPPRGEHDVGDARDRRPHRGGRRPLAAGRDDSCTTWRCFGFTGRFCSARPTSSSDISDQLSTLPPIVIVRLRHVPAMDASGLQAIEDLADQVHAVGAHAALVRGTRAAGASHGARGVPRASSGDANILPNVQAALKRAHAIAVELDLEQQRALTLAGTKCEQEKIRRKSSTRSRGARIDIAPLARREKKITEYQEPECGCSCIR